MANIVIKDLQDNIELDRKAMRAITGGHSGNRRGFVRHPSHFFHNPQTFNELRLIPDSMSSVGGR